MREEASKIPAVGAPSMEVAAVQLADVGFDTSIARRRAVMRRHGSNSRPHSPPASRC